MDWGPIGYIGMISYGLYVWQGVLTGNGTYRQIPTWPLPVFIGAALTFVIAPLSFHFFERPISDLGRCLRPKAAPLGSITSDDLLPDVPAVQS
jgi:peptidoglycan/LPS O-acetylase OafA/YrhL